MKLKQPKIIKDVCKVYAQCKLCNARSFVRDEPYDRYDHGFLSRMEKVDLVGPADCKRCSGIAEQNPEIYHWTLGLLEKQKEEFDSKVRSMDRQLSRMFRDWG